MSALEREVASSADRASRTTLSVVPTPAATEHSVEGRLLQRLLSLAGKPPIAFVLWTGERVVGSDCAEVVARVGIADRKTLLGLVRNPQIRFGDGISEGRITID